MQMIFMSLLTFFDFCFFQLFMVFLILQEQNEIKYNKIKKIYKQKRAFALFAVSSFLPKKFRPSFLKNLCYKTQFLSNSVYKAGLSAINLFCFGKMFSLVEMWLNLFYFNLILFYCLFWKQNAQNTVIKFCVNIAFVNVSNIECS